jgi:hypothetical protein
LVDFKKNDKEKSERTGDNFEIELDIDRIKLGEEVSRKFSNLGLLAFYHGESKWTAPQMDNRLMKANEHCLREYNKL